MPTVDDCPSILHLSPRGGERFPQGLTKAGGAEMRNMPMGRALRVGIVAEESRGRAIREVLLTGLQGAASGARTLNISPEDVRIDVLTDVPRVREALHDWTADVLVVDPAHVNRNEELLVGLAECAAAIGALRMRIVLCANTCPASLQGLHALMLRRIECSLVVEGVDETHLAREVAAAAVVGPAVWSLLQPLHEGLDRLPVAIQAAWRGAIVGGASMNVKVIAYRARVSRRTLERWHERVALPTPGELLHRVQMSRARVLQAGDGVGDRAHAVGHQRKV